MAYHGYRHIVWDWNGSLLDDAWLCVEILNEIRADCGMEAFSVQDYREIFDFPIRNFYATMGFDITDASFEALAANFITRYEARRTQANLRPYAREALLAFGECGIQQSLLSAYRQETLESVVLHWRLEPHFERMIGLEDHYAASKLENGIRWTQELDCPPERILFIGDTVHDFEVARACGADCVLIEGGHQSCPRLEACGVPVLTELDEVVAALHSGRSL